MTAILTGCIYGLRDPRDGLFRYVGQTMNPDRRKKQHLDGAFSVGNTARLLWRKELYEANVDVDFVILESIQNEYPIVPVLLAREVYWCEKLSGEGHPLTNCTVGRITKFHLAYDKEFSNWISIVSELRENWLYMMIELERRIGKKRLGSDSCKADSFMLRTKHRLEGLAATKQQSRETYDS